LARSWNTIATLIDTAVSGPRAPGDPLRAGSTAQFDDYEGLTVNAMEAIWAAEGEVVDAEGTVRLDSEAARQALQDLGAAFRSPRDVLPGSGAFHEVESKDAFGRRSVLFMRNWPLAYRQLTVPDDESAGAGAAAAAPTDISVTRLPGPSALGGQNLAVASESRHPEAAQQLVEFLTSEASQQILFQDGGYAATRQRIYEDPYIRKNYGYANLLLEAVKGAKLRPVTPHYRDFSEEFRRIVLNVLRTGDDVSANDLRRLESALEGK
jgi:multiple sugar transport system substrate-binding protein